MRLGGPARPLAAQSSRHPALRRARRRARRAPTEAAFRVPLRRRGRRDRIVGSFTWLPPELLAPRAYAQHRPRASVTGLTLDLVEDTRVEVELTTEHLLIDRVFAGAVRREVEECAHVHRSELEVVRVLRRDTERETLRPRVQQMKRDGGDHRAGHGGGCRPREQANAKKAGSRNLGGGC